MLADRRSYLMGSAVLGQRAAGGTLPRGTANKSQPWGCIRSCVRPHQTWSHRVVRVQLPSAPSWISKNGLDGLRSRGGDGVGGDLVSL